MTSPEISILIPACNEEAMIGATLSRLERLTGDELEVLVGLDGCTDRTEDIVRGFRFPRVLSWGKRSGKPAALNKLSRAARGEIHIVHDVDWTFVADRSAIEHLISDFRDESLGGVVLPPHNMPFYNQRCHIRSRTFQLAAVALWWLHEFLLEKQCAFSGENLYVEPERIVYPMPLNIYRAEAVGEMSTVADDFERFSQVIASGRWRLKVYRAADEPHFTITRQSFTFGEHYRRRLRGHIARAQMRSTGAASGRDFARVFLRWCLAEHRRIGRDLLDIAVWLGIIAVAYIHAAANMKKNIPSAREAWNMRDARKSNE